MYLYSFVSLPAKTGRDTGSCLQCVEDEAGVPRDIRAKAFSG